MSGTGETTTPFLGLIKPPIGADQDVWGNRLNTNADTLDTSASGHDARIAALEAQVAALNARPVASPEAAGTVKWWPGPSTNLPTDYIPCDGLSYEISEYPDLYGAIGSYWGGNWSTWFTTPDLRGMTLVGMDQGTGRLQGQYPADAVGATGGTATYTLQMSQIPPHQHTGNTDGQGDHAHNFVAAQLGGGNWVAGGSSTQVVETGADTATSGNHAHNLWTSWEGGGGAHPNCQPAALGYWIIKAWTR